jgi:hypothetical protein
VVISGSKARCSRPETATSKVMECCMLPRRPIATNLMKYKCLRSAARSSACADWSPQISVEAEGPYDVRKSRGSGSTKQDRTSAPSLRVTATVKNSRRALWPRETSFVFNSFSYDAQLRRNRMGRKDRQTAKRTDIYPLYCHVMECDHRRGFEFVGLF